ncbi:MAG: hypothetical protein MJ252_24355 [archaeon]|nr:hypothetical protein [archaeon]
MSTNNNNYNSNDDFEEIYIDGTKEEAKAREAEDINRANQNRTEIFQRYIEESDSEQSIFYDPLLSGTISSKKNLTEAAEINQNRGFDSVSEIMYSCDLSQESTDGIRLGRKRSREDSGKPNKLIWDQDENQSFDDFCDVGIMPGEKGILDEVAEAKRLNDRSLNKKKTHHAKRKLSDKDDSKVKYGRDHGIY